MGRLLRKTGKDDNISWGAKTLQVGDKVYGNSAAQFWSQLVDEVIHDYSEANRMVLKTIADSRLTRKHLLPEIDFNYLLKSFSKDRIQEMWKEACEEIAFFGEPNPVIIQIYTSSSEQPLQEFSVESIDHEIFMFLVAWLLEWSSISEDLWNDEVTHGLLFAHDPDRKIDYELKFSLFKEYLHEGLRKRTVDLTYRRSDAPLTPC